VSKLHLDIKNSFKDHQMQNMNLAHQLMSIMTAVNFCELKISRNPAETLVAFSIGSGMVVSIYDPVTKAGGMLSFVLPESLALLPEKAERHPYMFADTGLHALLEALMDIGAKTENIKVVIAGGAQIMGQKDEFNIGLKNYQAVTAFFMNINLSIDHEDIGGISRRTLSLDIGSGCNIIQTLGQGEVQV
jgi:chemotaxis protein CheD